MTANHPGNGVTDAGSAAVPRVVVFLLVAFVLLVIVVVAPPMAEQLLLGWLYFPFRVAPKVTADWPTVALGAVSMGLFITGLHRTLKWCLDPPTPEAETRRRWSLRSTLILSIALWVLFGAGTAMVAATHQAVWLISGRVKGEQAENPPRVLGLVSGLNEQAQRMRFEWTQKNLGSGIFSAETAHTVLPPGGTMTSDGRLLHGWASYIAPYLMLDPSGIDYAVPWNESPNDRLFQCAVPEFLNPAIPEVFNEEGYGFSHVSGNVHVMPIMMLPDQMPARAAHFEEFARWHQSTGRPLALRDVTDGTAHTILLGEIATHFKPWGHPANVRDPALGVNRSPDGFGSRSTTGETLFLMCDGAVRSLSPEIDPAVMRALATPSANDAASVDF
jgi:hypothetical protein